MAGTSLDERVTRLEAGAKASPIEVCHTSGDEAIGIFVHSDVNSRRAVAFVGHTHAHGVDFWIFGRQPKLSTLATNIQRIGQRWARHRLGRKRCMIVGIR